MKALFKFYLIVALVALSARAELPMIQTTNDTMQLRALLSVLEPGGKVSMRKTTVDKMAWLIIKLSEERKIDSNIAGILNGIQAEYGLSTIQGVVFFNNEKSLVLDRFICDGELRYKLLYQVVNAARELSLAGSIKWPKYTGPIYGDL